LDVTTKRVFMCTAGTFGFQGWMMSEMPEAQKRGSSSAPGICLANSGAKVPWTVEVWTPAFSNTRPVSMPIVPPPPGSPVWSVRVHGLRVNRPGACGASGSNGPGQTSSMDSSAAMIRPCRASNQARAPAGRFCPSRNYRRQGMSLPLPLEGPALTTPDALAIARDLIRCPSVTPEDGGALGAIQKLLEERGFRDAPGALLAGGLSRHRQSLCPHRRRTGGQPRPEPDVRRTYGRGAARRRRRLAVRSVLGEIADDMLWGRGAVDMKGGLAAAIAATLAYLKRNGAPRGAISFLITGDEEGPAVNGTVKLLEWAHARGERFDHCILPEPTNPEALGDMIKIGRRGSLSGTISIAGKQGHVGYPHLADNPVHHIVRMVSALLATPLDAGTAHFDASNLEVTSIDVGNTAVNVIPAAARAQFNIRFNDLWTPETLADEVARGWRRPPAAPATR
jgi:succinyl-diaminopimelate desuccinylase